MNKLYISPEFEVMRVEMIEDIILSSPQVEGFTSYVDPNPGDWGDVPDPGDEDINW